MSCLSFPVIPGFAENRIMTHLFFKTGIVTLLFKKNLKK